MEILPTQCTDQIRNIVFQLADIFNISSTTAGLEVATEVRQNDLCRPARTN